MNYKYIVGLAILLLSACQENSNWKLVKAVDLDSITPIGLAIEGNDLWIADGDNNRVVHLNLEGEINNSYEGFERPMHIAVKDGSVYIPEYGADQVVKFDGKNKTALVIKDSLDAPAGVSLWESEYAIVDFYNHRILYFNGTETIAFGSEGKTDGLFYYPTDVQLTKNEIFVADAYNNRVQVFDKKGQFLRIIGSNEKMNATTGLGVFENELFVTDFENDRVLIYDLEGNLQQIIDEGLDKPTDVFVDKNLLYIANYKGKNLMVYVR